MDISCPGTIIAKTIFAPLFCLCSFVKDQLTISVSLFLGSLFCPIDLFGSFDANSVVFDYCFYSRSLEVEHCQSFNFVLIMLDILALLILHINFRFEFLSDIILLFLKNF